MSWSEVPIQCKYALFGEDQRRKCRISWIYAKPSVCMENEAYKKFWLCLKTGRYHEVQYFSAQRMSRMPGAREKKQRGRRDVKKMDENLPSDVITSFRPNARKKWRIVSAELNISIEYLVIITINQTVHLKLFSQCIFLCHFLNKLK